MRFLGAEEIEVRTAPIFGLSIRHIDLYMDLLMDHQDRGIGAVVNSFGQLPGNETIATIVLVETALNNRGIC
ncbi:hypothetical protein PHMEG_0007908 [Phytophthora megakarya]|uniref:Uncharacterized protein n=1 Tax=Phytophthora megakarya TaxID=4795 RepID=A0A225WKA7_9STRA|nr:hypothetical protein PHMEG_0007908 [Phytophthora megakarya]